MITRVELKDGEITKPKFVNGELKAKLLLKAGKAYNGKNSEIAEWIPCGKCINCQLNQSAVWAGRLMGEFLTTKGGADTWNKKEVYFLTLTYSDDNLTYTEAGHETLNREDLKNFKEKLKKQFPELKYYLTGHYGGATHRPHYHGIIFGVELKDLREMPYQSKRGNTLHRSKTIDEIWENKGKAEIIRVRDQRAMSYVAGHETDYLIKLAKHDDQEAVYHIQSPGLGKQYYLEHREHIKEYDNLYIGNGRGKCNIIPTPTYYKNLLKKEDEEAYFKMATTRFRVKNRQGIKDTSEQDQLKLEIKLKRQNMLRR